MTRLKASKLICYAVFACLVIPMSPLSSYVGFSPQYIVPVISIVMSVVLIYFRGINKKVFSIVLVYLILNVISSIYWESFKLFQLPALYIPSLIIASLLRDAEMQYLSKIFTYFSLVAVVSSFFGFIYAYVGLPPNFQFVMGDGRDIYFFASTLSNSFVFNGIRPSFIFDEPGTLAFVIAFVVTFNELTKSQFRKWNFFILLVGCITFSLAHFLFFIIYLIYKRDIKLLLASSLFAFLFFVFAQSQFFDLVLYNRFEFTNGFLSGDNRSSYLINSFQLLNESTVLWGLDPACLFDRVECYDKFGVIGEHLIAPLLFSGLFASLFYYSSITWLLCITYRCNRYRMLIIGITLLLFQRPYSLTLGYSLMVSLVLFTYLKSLVKSKNINETS